MFVFDLFLQNDAYCLQIILQRKNLTSSIDQIDPNFSITLPLVSVFLEAAGISCQGVYDPKSM